MPDPSSQVEEGRREVFAARAPHPPHEVGQFRRSGTAGVLMALERSEQVERGSPAAARVGSESGGAAVSESAAMGPGVPRVRASALREELAALSGVVPVPGLLDVLLERAFEMNATDAHFDPQESGTRVRLRLDGMLHDVLELPTPLALQVVSRLKLMANMDIAEKRLPQDGHFVHGNAAAGHDVRIATAPTARGERAVLRLASGPRWFRDLEGLGMRPEQVQLLEALIAAPYGMVLGVGPVGSGKTTTIYTCLKLLNEPTKSLASIEDPIEYLLPGVNQMQVDARTGVEFANGLRALMRQDPDVAMVGEIRDAETAHTAVRAALTGMVLLSTMHANDAPSAIDVLHEHRVPSMLVADALRVVVSQRLLRKLCVECRKPVETNEATRALVRLDDGGATLFGPRGCDVCFGTGYRGRTGVFEIMPIDRGLRRAIVERAAYSEIRDTAVEAGMTTLEESAATLVRDGTTSIEEMQRVLTGTSVGRQGHRGHDREAARSTNHETEQA